MSAISTSIGQVYLLLPAILALAALMRFYALSQRGFIYWDEGKFALEGIRLEAALQSLVGSHVVLGAGKAVGTAKPTHALLIGVAYMLFGVHDYVPLLLNAAAGVVEVLLVYLIARRLFSPGVGLIAALFLAVSEYDVIYARSALSESDANAFLLGGVLLWIIGTSKAAGVHTGTEVGWTWTGASRSVPTAAGEGVPRRSLLLRLLAGLLMGVAFTTNYRLIVYIGVIVAFDLVWGLSAQHWREEGWRSAAQQVLSWGLGLVIAPLLWQMISVVAGTHGGVLFENELTGARASYLQQVLYQLHGGKQAATHFEPGAYVLWYLTRQGWLMALAVLTGLVIAVRRRSFPWLAMAVPVVVPYGIYTLAPFIVPRNLDAAIPLTAVLAAAGLVSVASLMRLLPARNVALVILVLVLAGIDARLAWRLTGERSGFARAAAYVARHDRGRTLSTSEILMFYLSGNGLQCTMLPVPRSISRISADLQAGYRYAIVDHFNWHTPRWLSEHMPVAAVYPSFGRLSLGENVIYSDNTGLPNPKAPIPRVFVYRLNPAALPPAQGERPDVCNRDTV